MLEWRLLLLKCCFFFFFFLNIHQMTWLEPPPQNPPPHPPCRSATGYMHCTMVFCWKNDTFFFNTVHKFSFISTVISYPALVQAQGSSNNASNFCISFNVGNVKHIVLTVQHLLVFLLLPLLVWVLILQRKKKIVIDFFLKKTNN